MGASLGSNSGKTNKLSTNLQSLNDFSISAVKATVKDASTDGIYAKNVDLTYEYSDASGDYWSADISVPVNVYVKIDLIAYNSNGDETYGGSFTKSFSRGGTVAKPDYNVKLTQIDRNFKSIFLEKITYNRIVLPDSEQDILFSINAELGKDATFALEKDISGDLSGDATIDTALDNADGNFNPATGTINISSGNSADINIRYTAPDQVFQGRKKFKVIFSIQDGVLKTISSARFYIDITADSSSGKTVFSVQRMPIVTTFSFEPEWSYGEFSARNSSVRLKAVIENPSDLSTDLNKIQVNWTGATLPRYETYSYDTYSYEFRCYRFNQETTDLYSASSDPDYQNYYDSRNCIDSVSNEIVNGKLISRATLHNYWVVYDSTADSFSFIDGDEIKISLDSSSDVTNDASSDSFYSASYDLSPY